MATCISRFLCIALFLLTYVHLGSTSLRCYTCKSQFNGDCDDVRGRTLPDEGCENSKLVKAFPQAGTSYVCVVHRMSQSGKSLSFTPVVSSIGYITSNYSDNSNYLEIHLISISFASKQGKSGQKMIGIKENVYKKLNTQKIILILPKLIRPKSKEYIKLKSNDSCYHPLIYPNYLSDPDGIDKKTLIFGIRFIQKMIKTEALKPFDLKMHDTLITDCEDFEHDSDPYWNCVFRLMTSSGFHQKSTCKMEPADDPMAVVDHDLLVYGIKGLRVVDCSVHTTTDFFPSERSNDYERSRSNQGKVGNR
ncbi:hypothetical protein FQR65_LT01823 [Abscondita terminalis]|nr:hypothetical protein FQR65_LT01823 [Abscondita terminalis]